MFAYFYSNEGALCLSPLQDYEPILAYAYFRYIHLLVVDLLSQYLLKALHLVVFEVECLAEAHVVDGVDVCKLELPCFF